MKLTFKLGILIIFLGFIFNVPLVSAQKFTEPSGVVGSGDPANQQFQLVPCTGVTSKDANGNTVGKECTYEDLIVMAMRIIQFVIYMMTPIVVVMILYSGFKYMTAGGDANIVADAKRMFKPIIIGLILILTSWLVVYTVLDKLLVDDPNGNFYKSNVVPATIK